MEKKLLYKAKKILPFFAMLIFCFMTLKYGIFSSRIPWEDEAHAWTIAQHLNVFQIIKLMKVEGHFLLWYLCIMPFAKFNLWYPYPMLLINWGFCTAALIIMWIKAPFNHILKLSITFSMPFLAFYSIHARCYSIGIFLLFLAAALYKQRLEHPYKYILLLVLIANTNLQMCIAAAILGILFVIDIFNTNPNKKLTLTIIFTLIFNLLLFYFQFWGATTPDYNYSEQTIIAPGFLRVFLGLEYPQSSILAAKIYGLWAGVILFIALLLKHKQSFIFFTLSSSITMFFFTYIYTARAHHVCLIYIFAIAALWIYKSNDEFKSEYDPISIILILISIGLQYINTFPPIGEYKQLADLIIKDKNFHNNSVIYAQSYPMGLSVILPYIEKENIYIYDTQGRNLSYYEGLMTYFNRDAKAFDVDKTAKLVNYNKNNFLISQYKFKYNYINGEKYRLDIEKYNEIKKISKNQPLYIYKIKGYSKAESKENYIIQ